MKRKLISSCSPYESIIGFSRAIRVGNFVAVGGTAPIDKTGSTVGINDPAKQTHQCIKIIESALNEAGATLENVIRTRILVTDINYWQTITEAKGEYFRDIRPVDTVMEVSSFINPEWLVEIEVDAIITHEEMEDD